MCVVFVVFFFFQAEDGIRDLVRSRGLGDVYKRQRQRWPSGGQWRHRGPADYDDPRNGTAARAHL